MSAIFLLMLADFANIFPRFPHIGIAMDSFQVVDHREESIYGMSFEFVVLRALDVSKAAINHEKTYTVHVIRKGHGHCPLEPFNENTCLNASASCGMGPNRIFKWTFSLRLACLRNIPVSKVLDAPEGNHDFNNAMTMLEIVTSCSSMWSCVG